MMRISLLVVVVMVMVALSTVAMANVTDTFGRPNSQPPNYALGSTELPGDVLPWIRSNLNPGLPEAMRIENQQLVFSSTGDYSRVVGATVGGGFTAADIDMTVDLTLTEAGSGQAIIVYRDSSNNGTDTDGYQVWAMQWLNEGTRWGRIVLYRPASNLWVDKMLPGFDWSVPRPVRVRAVGDHHQVWLDGDLELDVTNGDKIAGGYFTLGRMARAAAYDNLALTVIPEPSSLLVLLTGVTAIAGAIRRRR